MATAYKVLGQLAPLATTETDLYTVPAATQAVCSALVVANRDAAPATFRVSVSVAGAATTTKDYLYYEISLNGRDTFMATIGITLAATDKVRVYASTANLSFTLFGSQLT